MHGYTSGPPNSPKKIARSKPLPGFGEDRTIFEGRQIAEEKSTGGPQKKMRFICSYENNNYLCTEKVVSTPPRKEMEGGG